MSLSGAGLGRWRRVGLLVVVVCLVAGLVTGVTVLLRVRAAQAAVVVPEVALVQTGGTTLEADVVLPDQLRTALTVVSQGNGRLQWVKANGDGATTVDTVDLTPRTDRGDVIGPKPKRTAWTSARLDRLQADVNGFDTSVAGRSMLAGLQQVPTGSSDVWVVSLGLDTVDPMDARLLGFDVPITEVIDLLTRTGELPRTLAGRTVWFVWSQPTGEQPLLRQPQQLYREQLAAAIVTAAGGRIGGYLQAAAGQAGAAGSAPVVPIPPAPSTLTVHPTTSPTTTAGQPGTIRTCVLPTQILFQPDSDILVDPAAATSAVKTCLGDSAVTGTTVALIGHTACTSNPAGNPAAIKLSTDRAARIKTIVISLGIPDTAVTADGVGATQPIRQPCTDQSNRAVQLTATIPN